MGDAAFWLARFALATAGAAFTCYLLVLVCLVLASRFLYPRPRRFQLHLVRRPSRNLDAGNP